MSTTERDYLTEPELSEYLAIPRATLRQWRYLGTTGPPYVAIGRHIRYPKRAVDQWIAGRLVTPNKETQ